MNSSILSTLLLCIHLVWSHSLAAQQRPKLTIVTEHLPPFQIVDKNYSVTGFTVDVVSATIENAHYPYEIQSYPWVRSYNLALTKPNYCIFSMARIPTREKLFKWIGKVTQDFNATVWGLKKDKKDIHSINELKNYVIAVNQDDATHIGMVENGFIAGQHLYIHKNSNSLLNLLVTRKEIDFIIADDISITHRAKLANIDINSLYRVIELTNLPLNFYLACSLKTDDSVINDLTHSLDKLYQDGSYQKIIKKWQPSMPYYTAGKPTP